MSQPGGTAPWGWCRTCEEPRYLGPERCRQCGNLFDIRDRKKHPHPLDKRDRAELEAFYREEGVEIPPDA